MTTGALPQRPARKTRRQETEPREFNFYVLAAAVAASVLGTFLVESGIVSLSTRLHYRLTGGIAVLTAIGVVATLWAIFGRPTIRDAFHAARKWLA